MNLRGILKRYFPLVTKGDLLNHYRQIESLLGIYSLCSGDFSLGHTRGFAISPDALLLVLKEIKRQKSSVVVEFGCGQSTLAIARILMNQRVGRLFSIEHDQQYLNKTSLSLEALGLRSQVVLIHAPLKFDKFKEMTYDVDLFPKVSPNLVLVDGPSGRKGARLSPLLWSFEHLAPGGSIFVDDYNREEEKRCVSALLASHAEAEVETLYAEKGLALIRRG